MYENILGELQLPITTFFYDNLGAYIFAKPPLIEMGSSEQNCKKISTKICFF